MSDDADAVLLLKAVSDALSPDELKEAFSNLAAAIKVSSISVSKSQVTDTALEKKAWCDESIAASKEDAVEWDEGVKKAYREVVLAFGDESEVIKQPLEPLVLSPATAEMGCDFNESKIAVGDLHWSNRLLNLDGVW